MIVSNGTLSGRLNRSHRRPAEALAALALAHQTMIGIGRFVCSAILVLASGRASGRKLRRLHAVACAVKICGKSEIDFCAALEWLSEKWKIKRLLCEGGGELNGALFRAGLVNELHLTACPKILGGRDTPTIADGTGGLKLADATRLVLKSTKRVGDELFLVYDVLRK